MAIKVIKHGQKPKFKKVCSNCGCEFEYEQEDVITDYNWNLNSLTWNYPRRIKRVVICPDCGEKLLHDTIIDQDWYPPSITYTLTNDRITSPWPDCDKCPNKPDPNKPATVGDTPCTWCIKNRPYCTTTTTIDGNNQNFDFNNLHAYTSYANVNPPKEEKKLDLEFAPEDIDLPE